MEQNYPINKLSPAEFPTLLQEINDPPKQLYWRGTDLETWYDSEVPYKFLTTVGSRKYSDYAKAVVEDLIASLAGFPIVIISGLAIGIDSLAHRSALQHNLPTIAIPGGGLNDAVIYPAMHKKLAQDILTTGGTLLSEYEPDFKPTLWSFPRRNRIVAGLSNAVLIIEARKKSGSLITARLAMEYNRDVLAVEHSIFSPGGEGPHNLIKNGAVPIRSGEDILEALGLGSDDTVKQTSLNLSNFSSDEQTIINLIQTEPLSRDEIIRQSGLSASAASVALATLELKNTTTERLGKIHLLSNP